ncbi:MAG: helix-turn-helix transcriptional regulator [bacterium]|nr:helix-turn-helix transcriptional regulator [bacterium]
MRHNLKQARRAIGMKQREVAQALGITIRYYQKIEAGDHEGRCALWDKLQELFGLDQRELRKNTNN